MYIILIISVLLSPLAYGDSTAINVCEALNLSNCEGITKQIRRTSAKSLPSAGTATQFNPANVSHDRGFGVETFYQPTNSPTFSFVTGTGKAGAALVSSKIENAFFGNRSIELDEDFIDRRQGKKQYKSDKYSLALGAALFKRRNFSLDVGLLAKYNTDIKRINPGAGAAVRIGPISLGASVYQDDVFLKFGDRVNPFSGATYASEFGADSYQEKFKVKNFFAGVVIGNLFLDMGSISTHYKFYEEDVSIKIYSASYIWKKFLFNVAMRDETSPSLKYNDGEYTRERDKKEFYTGLQYSLSQNLIVGLHYNYYLLQEVAGSLVLFF